MINSGRLLARSRRRSRSFITPSAPWGHANSSRIPRRRRSLCLLLLRALVDLGLCYGTRPIPQWKPLATAELVGIRLVAAMVLGKEDVLEAGLRHPRWIRMTIDQRLSVCHPSTSSA